MNKKLWRRRWIQGPSCDYPINATQAPRLRPVKGQCPEELLWTLSWASSCPPVSAVLHQHYHHPHCCRCWNFSSCHRGLMKRCKDKEGSMHRCEDRRQRKERLDIQWRVGQDVSVGKPCQPHSSRKQHTILSCNQSFICCCLRVRDAPRKMQVNFLHVM